MGNNNSQMIELLTILLIVFIALLFVLVGILVFKKLTKRKNKADKNESEEIESDTEKSVAVKSKETIFRSYTKESVFNFMEFDKIEDNMIIQKKGRRFLMVIECQGINYDLMSELEKVAVEEGFLQFLNTLRYPIQLYVQSRTVNLTSSIENYNKKLEEYKAKLDRMLFEYEKLKKDETTKPELLKRYNYELTRQKNLYEYGKDIIENTEKMNLNKNVLSKKYYVIIPYYTEEDVNVVSEEDVRSMAFAELYTRAQAIIRTLAVCDINSKILNSTELINLLYVAYNRDESEVFDMEKIVQAGCEDIYSTAPDVFKKKIKALDNFIAKEAQERAESAFEIAVKSNNQRLAESKEENIEDLIDELAKQILEDNVTYIGQEVAEEAKKIVDETKESKGGKGANEKKKTTRTARVAK